jgi:hypothetical protein
MDPKRRIFLSAVKTRNEFSNFFPTFYGLQPAAGGTTDWIIIALQRNAPTADTNRSGGTRKLRTVVFFLRFNYPARRHFDLHRWQQTQRFGRRINIQRLLLCHWPRLLLLP